MPRGGYRVGAGGISTWNHGKTKTIRVPEDLAEEILRIARALDEGQQIMLPSEPVSDAVTESKVLDLSGVSVTHVKGEIAVRLEDLVRAGYEIFPSGLSLAVEALIRRKRGR